MTGIPKEEAIKYFEDMKKGIFLFNGNWLFDMAIEALKEEAILDKIRAEIMDTGAYEQETMGQTAFLNGINYCLSVFDKYIKEGKMTIVCLNQKKSE